MGHIIVSLLNTAVTGDDALETPLGTARWWAASGVRVTGKPRFDHALSAALRAIRDDVAAGATAVPRFRGEVSDAILFEVLHAARQAAADGTLARIRRCKHETCRRYFLDETKNGSRRWCSLRCMERSRTPRRRTLKR